MFFASLSSSLPNPPLFNLSFKRQNSHISEPHKGKSFPFQFIPFFHEQSAPNPHKVHTFNKNRQLPAKQQVKFLHNVYKNARFSQFKECRTSRVFKESDERTGDFEIENCGRKMRGLGDLCPKDGIFNGLNGRQNKINRNRELPAKQEVKFLDKVHKNALFSQFEECRTSRVFNETDGRKMRDLGDLCPKDGIFNGLDGRENKINDVHLVKKIISLPDEERVKILDLFNFDYNQLSVSDHNDILMALVKAGEYESAEIFFSEFSSRGLSPDCSSFSAMIQCFCKKNEPEKAKEVLDVMLKNEMHPNSYTFTGLISCFCKKGKLKKAYEIFDIMKRVGCEPNLRNYNSLIYGLCYVGKVEEALQILNDLKNFREGPDIHSFNFVMNVFCKVGRTDEAMELLTKAQNFGLNSTNATLNCLINGYCKEGRPLKALHLLKEIKGGDFMPNAISYNALLQGVLKCGEIQESLWVFWKMREADLKVDDRAVNTLVRCLCRQFMIHGEELKEEAKEVFEEIKNKVFGVSSYTYCLIVQALAEGGEIDSALSYLKEMIEDGYVPRIVTYNVVFRILCSHGRVDDALGVFVLMIERDIIASEFCSSILIDEFGRRGRFQEAAGVYSIAVKRGVSLNRKPRRDWMYKKTPSCLQLDASRTD